MWTKESLIETIRARYADYHLVIVSSRQPYGHFMKDGKIICQRQPGGLVTALDPVMQAVQGTWIAVGDQKYDRQVVGKDNKVRVPAEAPSYDLRRIWLSKQEMDCYYYGYSNRALWPLCHVAYTRPEFSSKDWEGYEEVNRKFAEAILDEVGGRNAFVWLQDYHLTRVAKFLREANRPNIMSALFWHIPWPNPEVFSICPQKREVLEGLLSTDLLGFHTRHHLTNMLDTVDVELESRIDRERGVVSYQGHETQIKAFPISIDYKRTHDIASSQETRARSKALIERFGVGGMAVILGVDRIDYTKGILDKLRAVDRLLELHPEHKKKFVLLQQGQVSRIHIPRYKQLNDEINAAVEAINWKHSEAEWSPVILTRDYMDYEEIIALYRIAQACLITPLHDGMNLVAKEFCAARVDQGGVLVLSQFTGSAWELTDALIVNPYDSDGVAAALDRALRMDPEETRTRMGRMRKVIRENNIYRWAAKVLSALARLEFQEQ
ncbi:MAG: trehalose-6-phosphate synthase [Candidatus Omnitrophica bacterium]|nr:trehalose-6-phosphate synthase [Candidatus Omnitrophota bacterium]